MQISKKYYYLKILCLTLSFLFIIQLLPLSVWAEEVTENQLRLQALQDELSDYLYSVIDKETTATVVPPEPYVSETNPFATRLTVETLSGETVYYDFSEDISYIDANDNLQYLEISEEDAEDISFTVRSSTDPLASPVTDTSLYSSISFETAAQPSGVDTPLGVFAVTDGEVFALFYDGELGDRILQYQLGTSGIWTDYTFPMRLLTTQSLIVNTRVYDKTTEEIENGQSVQLYPNIGRYSATKDDVGNGSFVLPSGFIRTYQESTQDWFFSFQSSVIISAGGNVISLTGFDGQTEPFVIGTDGLYHSPDGETIEVINGSIIVGNASASFSYRYLYGGIEIYYSQGGSISAIVDSNQKTVYNWGENLLTISDNHNRVYSVTFVDGKPSSITDCLNNVTTYSYENGKLVAVNGNTVCAYDTLGRLIQNGDDSITYLADGRVAKLTKTNGSFIKYLYDDTYSTESSSGRVLVSDSRGVSVYESYDGFTLNVRPNEKAPDAVYSPEDINPSLGESTLDDYVVAVLEEELFVMTEKEFPLFVEIDDDVYAYYEYDNDNNVIGVCYTASNVYEDYLSAQTSAEEKTEYVYTDGKLISETDYVKVEGFWGYLSQTVYNYENDLLLSMTQSSFCEGAWQPQYSERYLYDNYGGIKETLTQTTTESTPIYTTSITTSSAVEQTLRQQEYTGLLLESDVQYTYNQKGNVTDYASGETTMHLTYDVNGQVTAVSGSGETAVQMNLGYVNGNISTISDQDGSVRTYAYDSYGNLQTQSFDIYTLTYNTLGSLVNAKINGNDLVSYAFVCGTQDKAQESYANGQTVNFVYDTQGQIQSILNGSTARYTYEYLTDNDAEYVHIYDASSKADKYLYEDKLEYAFTLTAGGTTPLDPPPFVPDGEVSIQEFSGQISCDVPYDDGSYSIQWEHAEEEDPDSFDGEILTLGNNVFTHKVQENDVEQFLYSMSSYKFSINASFDENGSLTERTLQKRLGSNSVSDVFNVEYTYSSDGRIQDLTYTTDDEMLTFAYTYDDSGNMLSESRTSQAIGGNGTSTPITQTTTYSYDDDGQLISASGAFTEWTYSYDARGNILSKNHFQNTPVELILDNSDSYIYGNSGWQDELTAFNDDNIVYDAAGNPTTYRGHSLTWTMGRRLASYDTKTYTYNEDGIRTSKETGKLTTRFYLDGTKVIGQSDGLTSLYFRYDASGEVVGFVYDLSEYFYVKNQMKDIVGIVNADGEIVVTYDYDPWGKPILSGGNTQLANLNPFRYRSYYYDTDTGLYYLNSRYYDPDVGRFINADEVKYINTQKNEFKYCNNNPANGLDLEGFFPYFTNIGQKMANIHLLVNLLVILFNPIKGIIEEQNDKVFHSLWYGVFHMSFNGCGLIAIYNILTILKKNPSLIDIIYIAETTEQMTLLGAAGTDPSFGPLYLFGKGIQTITYNDLKKADHERKRGDLFIITYVNKGKGIDSLSWHTVAVEAFDRYVYAYNGSYAGTYEGKLEKGSYGKNKKYAYLSLYNMVYKTAGWKLISCFKVKK